jgi:hypothetical protein
VNPTGLIPRFQSLFEQSAPGSRINEDGLGHRGRFAWIIDGATGLSSEPLTPGATDAAWLAGQMGAKLTELTGGDGEPDSLLAHLDAALQGTFGDAAAHIRTIQDSDAPSACLGLVALRQGESGLMLQGSFLGDVVALVPTGEGVVRWTDERLDPLEQKTLAMLGAQPREPGHIPEPVWAQIRENRGMLNRPDGYWVVSPRRAWAGQELRFEARVKPGQPVVLATDGFMRLVDVFEKYTDATLHAALAEGRGAALIEELRELERSDLMAGAYPRVKTHDDATVLVIAAELFG